MIRNKKTPFFLILFTCNLLYAQIPAGYYNAADRKKGAELKNAMYKIISNHVQLEYYSSSTYFRTTDWHPDGYFWDMYSNNKKSEWSGLNREHSLPKSWWSTNPASTVAYSDLHNLYPSDPSANTAKSNFPLGEVAITTFNNGVSKVGNNTFGSVYKLSAFEPADEYKGDFARTYFYFVTCYEDYASNWRSSATSSSFIRVGEIYPVFRGWSLEMLLKWHRQDPVSQKETDRNNNVFKFQQNRNPFIDYPDLAEYIWGTKTDSLFIINDNIEDPVLITPTNGLIFDFGEVLINTTSTKSIPVKGKGLTGSMSVVLYDNESNFYSITNSSISSALINRDGGFELPVKFAPKQIGNFSAKIILYDAGLSGNTLVNITGKAVYSLSIGDENNIDAQVYASDGYIYFKNIEHGETIRIYSSNGYLLNKFELDDDRVPFNEKGFFIVKTKDKSFKIILL